jgi:hypothetical protein
MPDLRALSIEPYKFRDTGFASGKIPLGKKSGFALSTNPLAAPVFDTIACDHMTI